MSYLTSYRNVVGRVAAGRQAVVSGRQALVSGREAMGSVLDTIGGAVNAGMKVIEDPALPEVVSIVMRLNATTKAGAGGRQPAKGIGLSAAVTPLKGFLFYRQHPWVVPAGVLAILGAIFYGGTRYGKKRGA